jgi:phosphoenolpyruvate carboxylase
MMRTLSDDVRLVGNTLGEVIRAHGGDVLFERVERMRLAAKRAREDADEVERARARQELADCAAELTPELALEVGRAFTLYFQLVNLAEDVHRTRELRQREMSDESVPESLFEAVGELARAGVPLERVRAALGDLRLTYVFTAHPTEARRRTTERLLVQARHSLELLDRGLLTPTENRATQRHLRAAVEALWEHAAERHSRPEVLEEVKAGLWYLRNVLLDVVPRVQRRLWRALSLHYRACDPLDLPLPVSFGSWMGADRDGNPHVNEAVTERTLELHRWIVLDRYIGDLDALIDPLAAVAQRLPASEELQQALVRAQMAVPELTMETERRNPREPLRRLVMFMRERIARTRTFSAGAYLRPEEFLDDLLVLRRVLLAGGATALPNDGLLDLIQRVRCFGFWLATVDIREDSRVHRRVIAELLADESYLTCSDEERERRLAGLVLPDRSRPLSESAQRLLRLFDSLRSALARFGAQAIHTYVISMAQSPVDVLEVLRLAELHHVDAQLDIAPLLETREALEGAEVLLRRLLAGERYRRHLERRGNTQELLVGYSDSMKQAGIMASRVAILDAQRQAAVACRDAGITLRLFHGRGGSVSRGGGPTRRAIRALPPETFSGQIKITEQGETRSFHFGNPDLAARYLEQTLGAALLLRDEARQVAAGTAGAAGASAEDRELLAELAAAGLAAYRELVCDPHLVRYFLETTPFAQIAALNIASRPARRKGIGGLDDLRAIPWVFAWSQSRHIITAWYGVGSALAAIARAPGGLERLMHAYQTSPFVADLLDNVQMALAKADMPIAARYAALCSQPEVAGPIFDRVRAEYALTCQLVLQLTRQEQLLDNDPTTQRSLRLRDPYVDPLSYIQVEALRRLRASEEALRDAWERTARVTVQGIAAGLRNTG